MSRRSFEQLFLGLVRLGADGGGGRCFLFRGDRRTRRENDRFTLPACLPARPTARPPKRVGLRAPREEQGRTAPPPPQPPRTMQDIVKGWRLFNNEIRAELGRDRHRRRGGVIEMGIIEQPRGPGSPLSRPLQVSLDERLSALKSVTRGFYCFHGGY